MKTTSYITMQSQDVVVAINIRIDQIKKKDKDIYEECIEHLMKNRRFFGLLSPYTRDEAIKYIEDDHFHPYHWYESSFRSDIRDLKRIRLQANSAETIMLSTVDHHAIFMKETQ